MPETSRLRRDHVVDLLARAKRAMHASEIANALELSSDVRDALNRVLDDLSLDGSVVALPGGKYRIGREGRTRQREADGARTRGDVRDRERERGDAPTGDDSREPPRASSGSEQAQAPAQGRERERGRDRGNDGARPREREAERGDARDGGGTFLEGTVSLHPRGFAFVSAAGKGDDVFVPAEATRGAMHGDTVRARVVGRSRKGLEGEITAILKRKAQRVAGVLRVRGKSAWLEPDDTRVKGPIVITKGADFSALRGAAANSENAVVGGATLAEGETGDGMAAVVRVTRFPATPDENAEGDLEAILGAPGDPNVEVHKILVREGIVESHPAEAEAEAQTYGRLVAESMLEGREDLTHVPLPTIDPDDARDHDDAVWVTRDAAGNYKVWIAIADVSAYVRPGTALDKASLERGNSIYLPDRAIPMLPRALSGNLCSLLPDVTRLCLACEVDLTADGEVSGYRLIEGYMRSAAKLTYGGVARALGFTDKPPVQPAAEAMKADLQVLADLARILRTKRMARGALDFDLPEAKVTLDKETRAPTAVTRRAEDAGVKRAYGLIEELMLLANETVAKFLGEKGVQAIYRVHPQPDEQKLERFVALCEELSVHFELDDARDPKRLSEFLKRISTHEKKDVLHMLLLRAMKQASYDPVNVGHFGLASPQYMHFTSPIRRYPDVTVHRRVRALLRGEKATGQSPEEELEALRAAAATSNECERRGMEIEREVVDLYRAIYMQTRLGEIFDGTVTAIVGSGLFVALDDPFCDVLVKLEALGPDSYSIDDDGLHVTAARSGDRISIGDRMRVVVDEANIIRRQVLGRRIAGEGVSAARRADPFARAGSDDSPKAPRRERRGGVSIARPGKSPKGRAALEEFDPEAREGRSPRKKGAKKPSKSAARAQAKKTTKKAAKSAAPSRATRGATKKAKPVRIGKSGTKVKLGKKSGKKK